jgi:putative PIN family toxin of toxin-antitoxin system
MIVVLDTNILVSALLSPFGPPARVLDLMLAGELQPAFDDRVLAEYRDVLSRPRFGFDAEDIGDLLDVIEAEGVAVSATPWPLVLPDPDDAAFVEVAMAAQAILITGNLRHFPADGCPGVVVMLPADFLLFWQDRQAQS